MLCVLLFDKYQRYPENIITKGYAESRVIMYYRNEEAMRKNLKNINDSLKDSEYEFEFVDPDSTEYYYLFFLILILFIK